MWLPAFAQALTSRSIWRLKPSSATAKLSGIATGLRDLDIRWWAATLRPHHHRRRPAWARPRSPPTSRKRGKSAPREVQADGTMKSSMAAVVGFFSCEMSAEQLATVSSPSAPGFRRARSAVAASPRRFRKDPRLFDRAAVAAILCRRKPAASISQLTARARRLSGKGLISCSRLY